MKIQMPIASIASKIDATASVSARCQGQDDANIFIHFRSDEGRLKVSMRGSDYRTTVSIDFHPQNANFSALKTGEKIFIPAKSFMDLIKKVKEEYVCLEKKDDDSMLSISFFDEGMPHSSIYRLPLFSSTHLESSVFDHSKANPVCNMGLKGLIKLLDKGMSCNHGSKLTFPIFCGAGMLITNGSKLASVASDGPSLTYAELDSAEEGESYSIFEKEMLYHIPVSGIKDILTTCSSGVVESDSIEVLSDGRQIFFKATSGDDSRVVVSTRVVECTQKIPYNMIIDQVMEQEPVAFNVKKIKAALDRIGIISKQGNSIVSLTVNGSGMKISASEGGVGIGDETIECEGSGLEEEVMVLVSFKRLQKALRVFDDCINVRILNGESKGVVSCESDMGDIISIVATIK